MGSSLRAKQRCPPAREGQTSTYDAAPSVEQRHRQICSRSGIVAEVRRGSVWKRLTADRSKEGPRRLGLIVPLRAARCFIFTSTHATRTGPHHSVSLSGSRPRLGLPVSEPASRRRPSGTAVKVRPLRGTVPDPGKTWRSPCRGTRHAWPTSASTGTLARRIDSEHQIQCRVR